MAFLDSDAATCVLVGGLFMSRPDISMKTLIEYKGWLFVVELECKDMGDFSVYIT